MSVQVALPPSRRLTARQRAVGLLAVGVARLLVRRSPLIWVRRVLTALRRGGRPASVAQVENAHSVVTSVSLRCGGEACLQRSVAVALLCRMGGVWPTWCVGVCGPPLQAHAWVEAEGRPVCEPSRLRRAYTTIIAI